MSMVHEADIIEDADTSLVPVSAGALAAMTSAEIDVQIATAKRFPRSITKFRRVAEGLACLDHETAAACVYSLPRDGKPIVGPSVRLAEIVMACYGNCRGGAQVIDIDDKFVIARGFFHDLESNSAISYEVRRRITTSKGKRYGDDMIGVTAAAACAIALRNAVFKGAPKALWKPVYDKACRMIEGEGKTLLERQQAAVVFWKAKGIKSSQLAAYCGKREAADLTGDDLVALAGLNNAIKDGETTLESAFAPKEGGSAGVSPLNEKTTQPQGKPANSPEKKAESKSEPDTKSKADELIDLASSATTMAEVGAITDQLVDAQLDKPAEAKVTAALDVARDRIRAAIAPKTWAPGDFTILLNELAQAKTAAELKGIDDRSGKLAFVGDQEFAFANAFQLASDRIAEAAAATPATGKKKAGQGNLIDGK